MNECICGIEPRHAELSGHLGSCPKHHEWLARQVRASTKKEEVFMDVALRIGDLGTCDRKHVGCVIVRDGRCVSWGYNGAPSGLPHCEETLHGWSTEAYEWIMLDSMKQPSVRQHEQIMERATELIEQHGCRNATHAEANALAFAARQGISTDGGELFVGVSPCETCARLIIAAGIIRVYYAEEYRKDDGIRLLTMASIQSVKL